MNNQQPFYSSLYNRQEGFENIIRSIVVVFVRFPPPCLVCVRLNGCGYFNFSFRGWKAILASKAENTITCPRASERGKLTRWRGYGPARLYTRHRERCVYFQVPFAETKKNIPCNYERWIILPPWTLRSATNWIEIILRADLDVDNLLVWCL